jgi:putative thioredoxin
VGSQEAFEALAKAVADQPEDDNARFDYIKALLLAGRSDDAKVAFAPVIAKAAAVRKLDALRHWMNAIDVAGNAYEPADATLAARIAANKRDFDARHELAQHHIAAQRWTAAMDELLEILMRDKAWNNDLARKTYVAILEIIEPPKPKVAEGQIPPEDPTVATYRRRLSSVVLS